MSKTPLVFYKEVEGKQVRVVVGECEVFPDGTLTGEITEGADEHVFQAIVDGGGKFEANLGDNMGLDPTKYIMKQRKSDGMPI